jgi:uncharacterized protein YdeI (YjbR/CyaY-like superfamily)
METFKDLPVLLFDNQTELNKWLSKNCAQTHGIWIKISKKNSGKTSVTYSEAVEEALCYGWIDGQINRYDGDYYIQKFTPRRTKSVWSKINVTKVENLIEENRMQPSGLEAVEIAKSNGTWNAAYDSSSTFTIPNDFQAALNEKPKAKQFFETLNRANKYAIYWHLETAKRQETRQARIEKYINMLNKGEKLH